MLSLNTGFAESGARAKRRRCVAFDSDCREGICGSCCLQINEGLTAAERSGNVPASDAQFQRERDYCCRAFSGKRIPLIKDLVIDRTALDRIIQAGGFISVKTGGAPMPNAPVSKHKAESAFESASCIQCGACVAACKNASAMLSSIEDRASGQAAPGRGGAQRAGSCHGCTNGRREVRRLLQYYAVRSRMPQEDLGRQYRFPEPGDHPRQTVLAGAPAIAPQCCIVVLLLRWPSMQPDWDQSGIRY